MKKLFYSCLVVVILTTNKVFAAQTSGGNTGSGGQTSTGNTGNGYISGATGGFLQNPFKAKSIVELFSSILDVIMILATPVIVIFIILAGFKFVTARGDIGKITEARNALLYAVIGGVLILGAQLIMTVLKSTIGEF